MLPRNQPDSQDLTPRSPASQPDACERTANSCTGYGPLSFRTADSPATASDFSHPYEAFGDQLDTRLLSVEAMVTQRLSATANLLADLAARVATLESPSTAAPRPAPPAEQMPTGRTPQLADHLSGCSATTLDLITTQTFVDAISDRGTQTFVRLGRLANLRAALALALEAQVVEPPVPASRGLSAPIQQGSPCYNSAASHLQRTSPASWCYKCPEVGHYAHRSSQAPQVESSSLQSQQEAPSLSNQTRLFSLGTWSGIPKVTVHLGNLSSPSEALIDTGASLSFLREDFLPPGALLDDQRIPGPSVLFLADGTVVQPLGEICVVISAFGKTIRLPFVVVRDLIAPVILGCNWCSAMELRLDFKGEDYIVALKNPPTALLASYRAQRIFLQRLSHTSGASGCTTAALTLRKFRGSYLHGLRVVVLCYKAFFTVCGTESVS
ncbi:hypothetical protein MTO96_051453 [Rhipicephalus appendiculatus]